MAKLLLTLAATAVFFQATQFAEAQEKQASLEVPSSVVVRAAALAGVARNMLKQDDYGANRIGIFLDGHYAGEINDLIDISQRVLPDSRINIVQYSADYESSDNKEPTAGRVLMYVRVSAPDTVCTPSENFPPSFGPAAEEDRCSEQEIADLGPLISRPISATVFGKSFIDKSIPLLRPYRASRLPFNRLPDYFFVSQLEINTVPPGAVVFVSGRRLLKQTNVVADIQFNDSHIRGTEDLTIVLRRRGKSSGPLTVSPDMSKLEYDFGAMHVVP